MRTKNEEIEALRNELTCAIAAFRDERASWILQRYILMWGLETLTNPLEDPLSMASFADRILTYAVTAEVNAATESVAIRNYIMPIEEI